MVQVNLAPVCLVLVSGMALDRLGVVLDQDQLSLEWDSVQASLVLVNLALENLVPENLALVYAVLVSLVPVCLVNLVQASLARGNVVFLGQDLVQVEHQGSQGSGNTLGMDHHLVHLVRQGHQETVLEHWDPVYVGMAS